MNSELTPFGTPTQLQPNSGGLGRLSRDRKTAREFSNAELEHIKRSRAIDYQIAEQRRQQYGEALLGETAISNANQLAFTAQSCFAEFIAQRDVLIGQVRYQKSADDILNFAEILAPELGRIAASEIQNQRRR
ncbi:hypothetical protein [Glutamicibacter sp. NPDC087344]|uniref:hypothetical protein n=1 Tax=Glutamicibacter sp. NPDC087344 TaxID=3363994 RepID=UPI00380A7BD3